MNNVGMFHYNYEDIFGEDKELVDEFACGEG